MESVTSQALKTFFQRLGEQIPAPVTLYLLGGSALCLLAVPAWLTTRDAGCGLFH